VIGKLEAEKREIECKIAEVRRVMVKLKSACLKTSAK